MPRIVRQSAELLRDAVDRYVFVSSVSAYADLGEPLDETRPSPRSRIRTSEEVMKDYGALKAACETVVEEVYGDRAVIVRAGPDRRPARPDRPLHVLAAADRRGRPRARPGDPPARRCR